MASSKLRLYDSFMKNVADDLVSLSTDTLKVALFTSTSNAEDLTNVEFADLTNEVAATNGYTSGGEILAGKTITEVAGVTTLNGTDFNITATGGSIIARFAVIYSDTSVGKKLVGYILLDTTPADITALDTQQFIIQWNANGILRISANNT